MNKTFSISAGVFLILSIIIIPSCEKDDKNTVSDIDGNIYHTVTISTQIWMVENLKTTKYSNGDLIGTTAPATLDIAAEATPKYQWAYDGDESNVSTYGRLYTWYAVTDTRKVCPTGWHVPSDMEWETLKSFLGGERVAGGKLKEEGTTHWKIPNTGATNETGFTALPGGARNELGRFVNIGSYVYFWSSTPVEENALGQGIYNDNVLFVREELRRKSGWSVRCIKD